MRVIVFTEKNSPYGAEILKRISSHNVVDTVLLVTRFNKMPCDYYVYDSVPCDLVTEAESLGVQYIQQEDLANPAFLTQIAQFQPDVIVLANYQKKVSQSLCKMARLIAINFHPSPLPRYAGLAPFFWMALNGEQKGGVSCCTVADVIDGGALLAQKEISLVGTETTEQIRRLHFEAAYELVEPVLTKIAHSEINTISQNSSLRTYFGQPTDELLKINWSDKTDKILKIIHAGGFLPGAIANIKGGKQVRIIDADIYYGENTAEPGTIIYDKELPIVATSDGWVRIKSIAAIGQKFDFQ